MNFACQQEAVAQLQDMAAHNVHSILLEGVAGAGKTYLARQYARLLEVSDFQVVDPSVGTLRSTIDDCMTLQSPVVLCIENLDLGVAAASYTILKFLEEPMSHVYIVVTCRNMKRVPDTIISRSNVVTTSPPSRIDIDAFANDRTPARFQVLKNSPIWKCATSFSFAAKILDMTNEQVSFYPSLASMFSKRDTVSNMVWKLGHYPDNTEVPTEIAINYIIFSTQSKHIRMAGIQCMRDLSAGRVAAHAAIARFVFECKYCE